MLKALKLDLSTRKKKIRFAISLSLCMAISFLVWPLDFWRYMTAFVLIVVLVVLHYNEGLDDGGEIVKEVWGINKTAKENE
jgi:hypothetical protein